MRNILRGRGGSVFRITCIPSDFTFLLLSSIVTSTAQIAMRLGSHGGALISSLSGVNRRSSHPRLDPESSSELLIALGKWRGTQVYLVRVRKKGFNAFGACDNVTDEAPLLQCEALVRKKVAEVRKRIFMNHRSWILLVLQTLRVVSAKLWRERAPDGLGALLSFPLGSPGQSNTGPKSTRVAPSIEYHLTSMIHSSTAQ